MRKGKTRRVMAHLKYVADNEQAEEGESVTNQPSRGLPRPTDTEGQARRKVASLARLTMAT